MQWLVLVHYLENGLYKGKKLNDIDEGMLMCAF